MSHHIMKLAFPMVLACAVSMVSSLSFAQELDDTRPDLTRGKERKRQERQGDFHVDTQGRIFRVSFPLYDRFTLTGQLRGDYGSSAENKSDFLSFGARMTLHKSLALDFSDEEIWWMMRHRFMDVTYRPTGSGRNHVRVSVLEGNYLRHDLNSFILLPAANNLRIPANFDIAADYALFEMDVEHHVGADAEQTWTLNAVEVASMALLMDFVRDEDYRKRFAIGPAGWHTMTRMEDGTWQHQTSALTALKVVYGVDHRNGRMRFYGDVTCGAALNYKVAQGDMASSPEWSSRCKTRQEFEWIVLAISDRPVSIPVEVRADLPLASLEQSNVEATVGLRIGFSLDR